jgi:hypothetical protein
MVLYQKFNIVFRGSAKFVRAMSCWTCRHLVYVVVTEVKVDQQAVLVLVCKDVPEKPVPTLKGMMESTDS